MTPPRLILYPITLTRAIDLGNLKTCGVLIYKDGRHMGTLSTKEMDEICKWWNDIKDSEGIDTNG